MVIREDFRNLIPPLSQDEFHQLEENCIREGIRDPLVVWCGVLVDGHNRYRIAKKHGLEFETVEKEFQDEDEAREWIIKNQFGRRNLSAYDRSVLALKLKPLIAEKAKENILATQNNKDSSAHQKSDKQINTSKELAKVAGVSHDTIHKVEAIENKATPRTKELVREGKLSINQAYNQVHPKQPNPIERMRKEHERFQRQKDDGVISIESAKQDKANTEILDLTMFEDVLKLLNAVDKFRMTYRSDDIARIGKYVKGDEKKILKSRCQVCIGILANIKESIGG